MLKKIISIKNVGTFRNSPAAGNAELRRLTLIHAENGRGKTTLCAVLRSLRSGNPMLVLERKTLDSDEPPHVKILVNSDVHEFQNGSWASLHPAIEVFDASFIAENVFSGDDITHDHKKNLCRIVLGDEGVRLAKAFDDQDEAVRRAGEALKGAKETLQKTLPRGLTLDAFLGLAADPAIDQRIADKQREIAVQDNAEAIRKHTPLATLTVPTPPKDLAETLPRTIADVAANAEAAVRSHIERHKMSSHGEDWLSQGLSYEADGQCPFCAQALAGSPIFDSLRSYFSKAYSDFLAELKDFSKRATGALSADALLPVQRTIEGNVALAEFWQRYATSPRPAISFDDRIEPAVRRLRDTIVPLIARKIDAPLTAIHPTPECLAAIADWHTVTDEVAAYNAAVTIFNKDVAMIKAQLEATNLPQLKNELATLETQKRRHQEPAITTVADYGAAKTAKTDAERLKDEARDKLNDYNAKVIDKYRTAVNNLLVRFGAHFTLDTVKVEYVGRTPRAGYTFALRGKQFDPGNEKTVAGSPNFRNTLSAGDRSTLALAFFIAQLQTRSDLADLVVVFDDPFTSLDAFRQAWTITSIRRLATVARQVIVLSHSLDFLRSMAIRCQKPDLSTLRINLHNMMDSRILELDLEDATHSVVQKDVIKLRSFVLGDDDDAPGAIRCIRPLLENHIRQMAPDDAPGGNGWLGNFLGEISRADQTSPLAQFKPSYDDLDTLNEYTSPYAHDSGAAPTINHDELRANGNLTLTLIGRGVGN